MAINVPTDKHTERLLNWLAKRFDTSKAEMVRLLIREKYQATRSAFAFGSLAAGLTGAEESSAAEVQQELKDLDRDHDLD